MPSRIGSGSARPSYLVHAGKCVPDNALATAHPRTIGSPRRTRTKLAETRDQTSPAAEGVLPLLLTLQEKTSRSLYRVATCMCKTTSHERRTVETAFSKPDFKHLKTSNLTDPSDKTELAAPMPSQVDANCKALKHALHLRPESNRRSLFQLVLWSSLCRMPTSHVTSETRLVRGP